MVGLFDRRGSYDVKFSKCVCFISVVCLGGFRR